MTWTPERLAELKAAQKELGTTEAAKKFKISNGRVYQLVHKAKQKTKTGPRKSKMRAANHIDISVLDTPVTSGHVAVIIVPFDQLKNVLGAL